MLTAKWRPDDAGDDIAEATRFLDEINQQAGQRRFERKCRCGTVLKLHWTELQSAIEIGGAKGFLAHLRSIHCSNDFHGRPVFEEAPNQLCCNQFHPMEGDKVRVIRSDTPAGFWEGRLEGTVEAVFHTADKGIIYRVRVDSGEDMEGITLICRGKGSVR